MEKALQTIKLSTFNFLRKHFRQTHDFKKVNDSLMQLCGISNFLRNEYDFLFFSDLLKPKHVISENTERREYGDFQTPDTLSSLVCSLLLKEAFTPDIIVEPTFGKGSFIISALKTFPKLRRVYGVEIHEPYFWSTKFAILELFIENPNLNKPFIFLNCEDIFKFDFGIIGKESIKENVLVLGNPPPGLPIQN